MTYRTKTENLAKFSPLTPDRQLYLCLAYLLTRQKKTVNTMQGESVNSSVNTSAIAK